MRLLLLLFLAFASLGFLLATTADTAAGAGLTSATAGSTATFTISAAEANLDQGAFKAYLWGSWTGTFANIASTRAAQTAEPFRISTTIVVTNPTTFTASYVPELTGYYRLDVMRWGEPITGSPFYVTVSPGPTDAQKSLSIGSATHSARVAISNTFTVRALDRFGNYRTTGGDTVAISIAGPGAITTGVSNNGDGTYLVSYTLNQWGNFVISVTIGGVHIHGSPFPQLNLHTAGPMDTCTSPSSNFPTITAGNSITFLVQARNNDGTNMNSGGLTFSAELSNSIQTIPGVTTDNNDGTYSMTFDGSVKEGWYIPSILRHATETNLAAMLVQNLPNAVHIIPSPNAAASKSLLWMMGPSEGCTLWAFLPRDAWGNNVNASLAVAALTWETWQNNAWTSSPLTVTPALSAPQLGSYATVYNVCSTATKGLAIRALINGEELLGSAPLNNINDSVSPGSRQIWRQRDPYPATLRPSQVRRSGAVLGVVGSMLHVVGGECIEAAGSSLPCVLNGAEWLAWSLNSQSWTVRAGPALSHGCGQAIGSSLFIFGGSSVGYGTAATPGNVALNGLWELSNTFTATSLSPTGAAPSARYHSACAAAGDLFYVFGGQTSPAVGSLLADLHVYNSVANTWTLLAAGGAVPSARSQASLLATSTQLFLFFGYVGSAGAVADVHVFTLGAGTWSALGTFAPSDSFPRYGVATVWMQGLATFIGGMENIGASLRTCADVFQLNVTQPLTAIHNSTLLAPFSPRIWHGAAVASTGSLYVYGGKRYLGARDVLGTLWEY